jgi:hypothetical protein
MDRKDLGKCQSIGRTKPSSAGASSRGFPFLGPGSHQVEGELPWVFDDMAPAGFLGARFANAFPELSLPATRNRWAASGQSSFSTLSVPSILETTC